MQDQTTTSTTNVNIEKIKGCLHRVGIVREDIENAAFGVLATCEAIKQGVDGDDIHPDYFVSGIKAHADYILAQTITLFEELKGIDPANEVAGS